jgi:hypothetical protein
VSFEGLHSLANRVIGLAAGECALGDVVADAQCPATTYVWQYAHQPDGRITQTFQADMRQGLVIDVYDSGVVVRGRDFSRHEWVPRFQATIPSGR